MTHIDVKKCKQLTIDDFLGGEKITEEEHAYSAKQKTLKVKRLSDSAILPTKSHVTDSGFDLYASEDVIIEPGETVIIPTGIAVELPDGTEAQIRPRSGITAKTKLRVQLGTIDYGYSGEIGVIIDNASSLSANYMDFTEGLVNGNYLTRINDEGEVAEVEGRYYENVPQVPYLIRKGDKIAQLVVQYLPQVTAVEVDEIQTFDRGVNGFGSTGVREVE